MTTKILTKPKTTSLQIPLNQSDKDIAELVTQEVLGLSLGSTIKMIVKIIAQKKEIPLNINLSQEFDETTWLLNNPGYGQRLLDSVDRLKNGKPKLIVFKSMQELQNHDFNEIIKF